VKFLIASIVLCASVLFVQNHSETAQDADQWKALRFLEGTWQANTQGGSAAASGSGIYTFQFELNDHVLARHSQSNGNCQGPAAFNCQHDDLLYVYQNAKGAPLEAIYFDNEGHVIHYRVSIPAPNTAIFESDAAVPGPQFRLSYELKDRVMQGKFQIRMPGRSEWKSYLEWSGAKSSGS
jgi:hypothetical protein